jgi:hypothetical protein
VGFVIYAYAVGAGAATGEALSQEAGLLSLRYLGGGLMLSGMALWMAKSLIEGDRTGLNPMFGLLLAFSTILLVIGVIAGVASGQAFTLGLKAGLYSSAAALVIGLLATVVSRPEGEPAYDYPWMNPKFNPDTDAYAAGMVVPTIGYVPDDLTRIAGIDEQVAGLLNEAGIYHFGQLANASPETLRDMLEEAGLMDVDPAIWPDQAILAANGEWDTLEELQEELTAEQPA